VRDVVHEQRRAQRSDDDKRNVDLHRRLTTHRCYGETQVTARIVFPSPIGYFPIMVTCDRSAATLSEVLRSVNTVAVPLSPVAATDRL
jgi:hypothetical protein